MKAIEFSCQENPNINKIINSSQIAFEKAKHKKRPNIIALIMGIPNVGKSSIINRLTRKKKANVGNRPAVTKSFQRINVNDQFTIIDTPGMLWPKFEEMDQGYKLAILGSIRDEILDLNDIAIRASGIMKEKYPDRISRRFKIDELPDDPFELLELIGRKRGCVISGGRIDLDRASLIFLKEIREGKLGKISLEDPEDI
jgi:ribosome biogenesis GTPase A